jgi:PAS domain-containing protein
MAVGGSKQARATAAPMVAVPAFARRLPPSCPVFRIAEPRQPTAVATSVPRIADPADPLHDAPLIKAAQRLAPGGNWDTFPTRITLNVPREVEEMLSAIDPYEVSTAAKMPLARVEEGLERLRSQHAAENTTEPRKPVSLSSNDQAVVQIALEEVALKADRTESAPPADAAADTGGKTPSAGRVLTIEETVARLRAEADRLSLAPQNDAAKRNEVAQRVQQLSSRLRQVSDGLLRHADFVSITDVAGRVRYGNGAFADLVSQAKRKGYETGWRAWEEAIASRPIGTSQLSSSIADARPRTWNLQRTLIEDETSGAATAYVNILRSAAKHKLAPDALKLIEPMLNEVTLHASFVTYGSPERCVKSIETLEQLTAELETIIDGAPAVRKGKQSK